MARTTARFDRLRATDHSRAWRFFSRIGIGPEVGQFNFLPDGWHCHVAEQNISPETMFPFHPFCLGPGSEPCAGLLRPRPDAASSLKQRRQVRFERSKAAGGGRGFVHFHKDLIVRSDARVGFLQLKSSSPGFQPQNR
jgi:hypothetical protein